jgi:alpha-methylacyl-CoA racemase
MMLADHGAEVIRIDRPNVDSDPLMESESVLARTRRRVMLDLKTSEGVATARCLCKSADALIEGYRPGVMERLGLGPEVLLADNPKLVYGRMTGWGQTGPLAQAAGHDINYIALSGALHTVGITNTKPVTPVNYVGDFGGGGMMLAFATVCALLAVKTGASGQVIDCSMIEGSALLASMVWQLYGAGLWQDTPGRNILDGAAHFYDTYECADGKYVAIGSIEPQFYAQLRRVLGLSEDPSFDAQRDSRMWARLKARMADIFRTRTRAHWSALMEGTDVCFAPVLSLAEAPAHPHNRARGTFVQVGGLTQPAPAPRYSGTPLDPPRQAGIPGADTEAVLREVSPDQIAALTTCNKSES